jgi:hypothetical protein
VNIKTVEEYKKLAKHVFRKYMNFSGVHLSAIVCPVLKENKINNEDGCLLGCSAV